MIFHDLKNLKMVCPRTKKAQFNTLSPNKIYNNRLLPVTMLELLENARWLRHILRIDPADFASSAELGINGKEEDGAAQDNVEKNDNGWRSIHKTDFELVESR